MSQQPRRQQPQQYPQQQYQQPYQQQPYPQQAPPPAQSGSGAGKAIAAVIVVIIVVIALIAVVYFISGQSTLKVRINSEHWISTVNFELYIDGDLKKTGSISPGSYYEYTFTLYPGPSCTKVRHAQRTMSSPVRWVALSGVKAIRRMYISARERPKALTYTSDKSEDSVDINMKWGSDGTSGGFKISTHDPNSTEFARNLLMSSILYIRMLRGPLWLNATGVGGNTDSSSPR
jgi:hypothetical protein